MRWRSFVAAQRGELQITPSDFDLLLRGVDLLTRISELTKSDVDELQAGDVQMTASITTLRSATPRSPIGKTHRRTFLGIDKQKPVVEPPKTATATVHHTHRRS